MIRVLLADDQALVRTGFRMILDNADDMTVVGEAADGEQAVAAVLEHRPDVVLMDVRMPDVDGVEATRRICKSADAGQTHVLILTTFDLDEYVYAALRAGASGFLLKDTLAADLLSAIRVVARGDSVVAPTVTRRLLERYVGSGSAAPVSGLSLDALTEREREVLGLIALGLTNTEIAGRLFLSEGTVKTHVHRILSKLELRDRVQAVVYAYESGLVRAGMS
ncbi:response regulator [Kribbella solani]|uniref:DNA-binding NarL/FixJ family response regulator n=1 Tax=Kribbella solani TaxID=236067 RepID=A0A841DXG2_9ACTN|nr:response regulator transcription factor [Kribbella solani]MBB5979918.1 DNA-binding NarL/FixJ family response regulator [Kribbella solani]MDX2968157.1 response regulator transcription factor [Kribbella solani]MDX3004830.1 response regulator transcription factor [Kribbella solani]